MNPNQLSLKLTKEGGSLSACFPSEKWGETYWTQRAVDLQQGQPYRWMGSSSVAPNEDSYWVPLDTTGILPVKEMEAPFFSPVLVARIPEQVGERLYPTGIFFGFWHFIIVVNNYVLYQLWL